LNTRYLTCLACSALLAVLGCSDTPLDPGQAVAPQFAKGGSSGGTGTSKRLDFDVVPGTSINGDGLGTYQDGVCGTVGVWTDVVVLDPFTSIPRSQRTACAGLPQRSATITLALLHGAASDHSLDQVVSTSGAGTYAIDQLKIGALGGGVVNMYGPCNSVDRKGNLGGTGLRLNPSSYPGTSGVISEDLGGGAWRFRTPSFPDNMAYCQDPSGTVTYWHVDIDVTAQIVG